MRTRLREAHDAAYLAALYAKPHAHEYWQDHRQRVRSTIALAGFFEGVSSVADLSAGDGAIINALDAPKKYIGDFAPKYEFHGAIEKTIDQIPNVDLFILSETLEHLDDPDAVLAKIRAKTRYLVLSTPDGEIALDNPEHYWGWDSDGVREMLVRAEFKPVVFSSLTFTDPALTYDYQMWGCK